MKAPSAAWVRRGTRSESRKRMRAKLKQRRGAGNGVFRAWLHFRRMGGDTVELDALECRPDALQRALRLDTDYARLAARRHDADLQPRELQREAQGFSGLQVDVRDEEDTARADVAHHAITALEPAPQASVESLVSARAHEQVIGLGSRWFKDGGRAPDEPQALFDTT